MNRRGLLTGLAAAGLSGCVARTPQAFTPAPAAPPTPPIAPTAPALQVSGRFQQGGVALIRTAPRARVSVDGEDQGLASANGLFAIGFDRDAAASATILVATESGSISHTLAIAPVAWDIQRIDGLPQNTVTPTAPALLARIRAEAARKAVGFASRVDDDSFADGFVMPVQAVRVSGRFGGQRILNGTPSTPHYGTDLACPDGTPIVAPAAGTVCFAEGDLHYEGGLTMIDHGQGLISLYLHQSRVDVSLGQRVAQGQPIGLVGMKGRATGPHLCWRLRWHGRQLEAPAMIGIKAPQAT